DRRDRRREDEGGRGHADRRGAPRGAERESRRSRLRRPQGRAYRRSVRDGTEAVKLSRRQALQTAGATLIPGLAFARSGQVGELALAQPANMAGRDVWIAHAKTLADPVLRNLAAGTLRARMPVEQAANADRRAVT